MKKKLTRPEQPWKLAERAVAALERTLTPEARIQHNVRLPDLLSASVQRQCDVVIRYGTPPRETITIVEVQRRRSSVELNDFHGWCEKMRRVGAQHLICVSRRPFPESIKVDAQQRGPTVRLLTLTELEREKTPLDFLIGYFEVTSLGRVQFANVRLIEHDGSTTPLIEVNPNEILFENELGVRCALRDLARDFLHSPAITDLPPNTYTIQFETTGSLRYLRPPAAHDARRRLAATIQFDIEKRPIPIAIESYEQLDVDGVLAWLVTASFSAPGDRDMHVRVTFAPGEDGRLQAKHVDWEGLRDDEDFFVKLGPFRVDGHRGPSGEHRVVVTEAPPKI